MSKADNKTIQDALDEIKLAFANFCADAQAIIDEAKERKNSRDKSRWQKDRSHESRTPRQELLPRNRSQRRTSQHE